jgi:DNA polymerase-3 subunit delta
LKASGAAALHAIVGGKAYDSFLAEEALERVLTATLGAERGESLSLLRGDETTWARVFDAARTRSLFVEQRVVVVRRADALKGEGDGLAALLDAEAPGVALVLMAAKVDKRRSVWKLVLDRAQVVVVEPLKEAALRRRLLDELRKRRLDVEAGGVEEIVTRVGQQLGRVMGELDKLEAYARGRGGRLSADEVSACLGRGFAQPLYRLSDAFASRDGRVALARMEEVLDEGEAPFMILGTLYRALRQVRGASGVSGSASGELASRLGVPPFKVRDVLEAARRWSKADLRRGLEALAEADQRIKTGVDGRLALTAAVALACGGSAIRPSLRPWR